MSATKSGLAKPPGSFASRKYKTIVTGCTLLLKVNKINVLKDIFWKAKGMKDFSMKSGEVAVITGAARGIGLEVLKKLLQCDYKVIIGIRDLGAGEKVMRKIRDDGIVTGSAVLLNLDLKSLKSVRKFAERVLKETPRIDLLINNAGIMLAPFEETEDGYESQFQVNYLGHFLLTNLLLSRIKETAAQRTTSCRIVNVSSDANYCGDLDFTDLEKCKVYSGHKSYGDSKFAQVLHAKYLDKLMNIENCNVRVYSLHPGIIPSNLWMHMGFLVNLVGSSFHSLFKTPEDGANVVLFAAMSPELENDGGVYINNCHKAQPNNKVDDVNLQKLLWERSIQLTQNNYSS